VFWDNHESGGGGGGGGNQYLSINVFYESAEHSQLENLVGLPMGTKQTAPRKLRADDAQKKASRPTPSQSTMA